MFIGIGIGVGLGSTTMTQKAIAILRKYGTDAHVYLPGIGTVSGLTAGNYLNSAGTTAATVDNPVGLSLDALQAMTLGSELVVNGTFSTDTDWTKAANWTIASGVATSNGGTGFLQASIPPLTAGKLYAVTVSIKRYVSGAIYHPYSGSGGVAAPTAVGTFTSVHLALSSNLYVYSISFNGDIDDVIVKEIPGIHATQSTTANKPILRLNSGKYSWQFDGSNDSLSLSAPLFQMSDDHCVIAGCSPAVSSLSAGVVSQTGTNAYVPNLGFLSGSPYAYWRDDALTVENLGGTSVSVGSAVVLTAVKISNAKRLRQNGVQKASGSIVMGTSTITSQGIGQGGSFWNGSIYPVIAIKGTVSDSDLLTLERFVGQLSGVSI